MEKAASFLVLPPTSTDPATSQKHVSGSGMAPNTTLRPPKPKTRKSIMPFNPKHEAQYGLKVASRDPASGAVMSSVCRFCSVFGREAREEKDGEPKRKRTTRTQHFSTFRTDLYDKHMLSAHPGKWESYQRLLTDTDREAFFGVTVPFQDTIHAHFESGSPVLCMMISKSVLEDVIGGLLFHPDDAEGMSKQRALAAFEKMDSGDYRVQIKTAKRFTLLVKMVALGTSFRMAARIVQVVRDETGMSVYTGCSDTLASGYCRVIYAAALQKLSSLLIQVTGFSLALDSLTVHSSSYLDVRVRFVHNGIMQNFHLLAIPLFESHTGARMCAVLVRLLSAVCPRWRDTLVAVSTDGEPKMTGRKRGLATLLEMQTTSKKLVRIWCALHQLDLVVQRVYKAALNDAFLSTLTAVIGHLRRQQLLISEMQTTCPKVADTRWLSMFACTKWLTDNMIRVQEHYNTKDPKPHVIPDAAWWAFLFAMHSLAGEASSAFTKLQGLDTLLIQQHATLRALAEKYQSETGILGPVEPEYVERLTVRERAKPAECDGYIFHHSSAKVYLLELDTSIEGSIADLPSEKEADLVSSVALMFVSAISGICSIVAERDSDNAATNEAMPVFPHQLVRLRVTDFNRLMKRHEPRLSVVLDATSIHRIGQEFVQLKRLHQREEAVRVSIDSASDKETTFENGWKLLGVQFPRLHQFCGDLATAFPNTSTVESDLSVMGWEKDVYRRSLTDFSLEGVLHAKQYQALKKLDSTL